MDGVFEQYRTEKVGKPVWMKFPVYYDDGEGGTQSSFMFYEGLITKCLAYLPDNNPEKSLEFEHFVYFGDKDDGYYNLTDQEATGYLKWSQAEADKAMAQEKNRNASGTAAQAKVTPTSVSVGATNTTSGSAPSAAPSAAARVVTPPQRKRSAESNQQARRRVKVKLEFGSTTSNIHDDSNNEINAKEFEDWLRKVHTGARGGNISDANARSVMNRVKDLIVKERGVTYKNWPSDIVFHQGETVTLDTDFDALKQKARVYESKYGKDKGNGWLLTHPIRKLELFRDYVEEKRRERANPEVLY